MPDNATPVSRTMPAFNRSPHRATRPGLRLAISLILVLQALCPAAVKAGGVDAAGRVIPLSNGLNVLSLTAAPMPAQAFLAHRDNANAHGFDVLTIYIEAPTWPGSKPQWQLVPVFDARDEKRQGVPRGEHLTLNVSGGADCLLHDVRLLAPTANADATLILADRELGDSFASPAPVTFRFFELKKNSEGMPGRPVYYFEFAQERQAAKAYCDVGDALQAEIGAGPDRPDER